MKKKIIAAVLSVAMVAPLAVIPTIQANAAGVPVFDASSFVRQLQQLQEAQKQFQQAKAQFDQFRGTRDIGKMFNQYGKYLPADMQSMYKDYQTGNWEGLAKKVDSLQKNQKLTGSQKEQVAKLLEQEKMGALQNKVKLDDMYVKSLERFNQIQRMANSVDLQNDPKAAADLLNRIQVENAMLSLQTNQLQMTKMLREAEVDLQRNQRLERQRDFNNNGGTRRGSTRAFS